MLVQGALGAAGLTGLSGLVAGCKKGPEAASDGPEQPKVRIGFVAVQSGAPIIVAHEKGLFKKYGLEATISKENGWAAVRDKLVSNENHATHLKYAQSLASTLGLLGSPKIPMVAPWTLSRNGSVFMVAKSFQGQLTFDPQSWKKVIDETKAKGEAFTIALPVPFGWHGLMYRYFLANAGINADKELKLITLPPAQMVQNMKIGQMQACAMVEPWGTRGVTDGVTVITMYGQELWKDHPIKSLAFLEDWANKNPKTVRAITAAIAEAAVWCDNPANRAELAKILAPPSYMNSTPESLLAPLSGELDWGDGRKKSDPTQASSYSKGNYPEPREMKWFLSQFVRWGMTDAEPDYDAVATKVGRADLYLEAVKLAGLPAAAPSDEPITLWDGKVFDPKKTAEYARSFEVHALKG
ncbi:ABC transporter substrate-binding protein [Myxococcota bacterium]|nr:ABC transporter substrate-binding protein [Myxococcota bacterium]